MCLYCWPPTSLSTGNLGSTGVIAIVRLPSRRRPILAALAFSTVFIPFLLLLSPQPSRAQPAGDFGWPLHGRIIRGFSKPTGPYGEGGHQGIDIAARPGMEVRAAGGGTVEWVGEVPRGRFVSVSHDGGVRTTCLDLERIDVGRGARVLAGQVLGTVGGGRDDSSRECHLHFDAYIRGVPVDPDLLLNGFDAGSFIRLCPVEGEGKRAAGPVLSHDGGPGLWSRFGRTLKSAFQGAARPFADAWRGFAAGCASARDAFTSAARRFARGTVRAWDSGVFPALRSAGRALKCAFLRVWKNRWVQAVVAGLAAALAIIVVIVAAVLVLSLSIVVGIVAAVAAVVASIAAAIVYAARHPSDFSFTRCFLKSLSAGCVAAGLAGSAASLLTAFTAGWAEFGLWGTVKSAFWSGVYSVGFDTSWNYLLTGQFSWKKALVAFGVGAFSGAIGKMLIRGIRSSHRVVEVLAFGAGETRLGVARLGRSLVLVLEEGRVSLEGFLLSVKTVAISLGVKAAYVGFSGTFGVGIHAVTCALTGKPITLSGSLAAFLTGGVMGAVALTCKAHGIGGLLEKLRFFREGGGEKLKGFASMLIGKALNKGLNRSFRSLFRRALKEEVPE